MLDCSPRPACSYRLLRCSVAIGRLPIAVLRRSRRAGRRVDRRRHRRAGRQRGGRNGRRRCIGAGIGALTGSAIGGALDDIEARNRAEIAAQLGRPVARARPPSAKSSR